MKSFHYNALSDKCHLEPNNYWHESIDDDWTSGKTSHWSTTPGAHYVSLLMMSCFVIKRIHFKIWSQCECPGSLKSSPLVLDDRDE